MLTVGPKSILLNICRNPTVVIKNRIIQKLRSVFWSQKKKGIGRDNKERRNFIHSGSM